MITLGYGFARHTLQNISGLNSGYILASNISTILKITQWDMTYITTIYFIVFARHNFQTLSGHSKESYGPVFVHITINTVGSMWLELELAPLIVVLQVSVCKKPISGQTKQSYGPLCFFFIQRYI